MSFDQILKRLDTAAELGQRGRREEVLILRNDLKELLFHFNRLDKWWHDHQHDQERQKIADELNKALPNVQVKPTSDLPGLVGALRLLWEIDQGRIQKLEAEAAAWRELAQLAIKIEHLYQQHSERSKYIVQELPIYGHFRESLRRASDLARRLLKKRPRRNA